MTDPIVIAAADYVDGQVVRVRLSDGRILERVLLMSRLLNSGPLSTVNGHTVVLEGGLIVTLIRSLEPEGVDDLGDLPSCSP